MIKGIYTSGSGMLPRILKQEIAANNIANANTAGFKKDSVFLQQLEKAAKDQGIITDLGWEIPMVDDVYIDFSQGQLQQSGEPLDVAIEGSGFFAVETSQGERYTRNGEFELTAEGVLIDGNGNKVLSDSGEIILAGDEITINEDGFIFVDGSEVSRLRLVDFQQPYNLRKADDGYFVPENPEDQPQAAQGVQIRQGYVEASNVNVIETMVDMLVSFRAYEAGQKAIHAQDETLDKAVNDVGRVR